MLCSRLCKHTFMDEFAAYSYFSFFSLKERSAVCLISAFLDVKKMNTSIVLKRVSGSSLLCPSFVFTRVGSIFPLSWTEVDPRFSHSPGSSVDEKRLRINVWLSHLLAVRFIRLFRFDEIFKAPCSQSTNDCHLQLSSSLGISPRLLKWLRAITTD